MERRCACANFGVHYFVCSGMAATPIFPEKMNDPSAGSANSERVRDQVFSARLEAIEARMDGRIASLEAAIHALIRRMEEKFAEFDARFAHIDDRFAQIDARFVQIDNRFAQIDNRFAQVDNRFAQVAARMSTMEAALGGMQNSIGGLRTTIIVTAIGAVIGVAAFNATVLNNMLASFESGRNVSAAQAQIQRQAEETAALLRQIQQGLPVPAKK